ncbi:MAG: hypothetical protein L6Q76_27840 [Polyangiaceae bacterium]|nr:hypothetical protein [Polyangiaceae bacterium]
MPSIFATPKSRILTNSRSPLFETKMFAGFRSRWITPAAWAAASAEAA